MDMSRITNNSHMDLLQSRTIFHNSQIFDEANNKPGQGGAKMNAANDPEINKVFDNEIEERSYFNGVSIDAQNRNMMRYADFHESFSRIVSNHRLSSDNLLNILKDAGKKPLSGEKSRKKSPFNTLQTEKGAEASQIKDLYNGEDGSRARVINYSALSSPKLKFNPVDSSMKVKSPMGEKNGKPANNNDPINRGENNPKVNLIFNTPQKTSGYNESEAQIKTSKGKPPLAQKRMDERDKSNDTNNQLKIIKGPTKNKLPSADSPSPGTKNLPQNMLREMKKNGFYDEANDVRKIVYTEPDYLTDSNMLVNIEKSRHCIVDLRRPNDEKVHHIQARNISANPRREQKECKLRAYSSNRVNQVYCLADKIVGHRKHNLDRNYGGCRTLPTEEEFDSDQISETPSQGPYLEGNEEEFMDERGISEGVVYTSGGVGMDRKVLEGHRIGPENARDNALANPHEIMRIRAEIENRKKNFRLRNQFLSKEEDEEDPKLRRIRTEGHQQIHSNHRQDSPKKTGIGLPSTIRTTSTANNDDITTSNNDYFSHSEAKAILNTSEFAKINSQEKRPEELHTFSFNSKKEQSSAPITQKSKEENCLIF